ncbi:hypothetical protein B296_00049269 [Ensete ventricosum]|uniref:Uncharacterized protein n=1 Tax=Ensete ventricosum TaxID=4639 RepID=A0A426YRF7_ENSVE|nr:hypothetical protein B296_00049269 [Ensete ventricosum]
MESLKSGTASSLLGPWKPHKQNSVRNMGKSLGARNAGRPFTYKDELYRPGQDCGGTYGQRIRLFNVKVLAKDEYEEIEVPLGSDEPQKGSNAWNGARYHHLDVQQLTSDQWVAVMDGDRVPSGDVSRRLLIGYSAFGAAIVLVILSGVFLREAYSLKGHYSQFTLVTITYDARLWNLKMYVKHYSICTSIREILVVWNKGQPPNVTRFDSAVPLRIRVEKRNSLNNRFNVDPLIKTRAVLELDDDIMMTCDNIERGFKIWRDHPDRIVGFHPRVAEGRPLRYRDEKYAREQGGYNMILTGAAFMDHKLAFERYWSNDATIGRDIVDKFFNCEDLLLNFLYANASSSSQTIEYVKPSWALDTSKFSGVAISRNTQEHYQVRSECLARFSELYGDLAANKRS